MDTIAYRTYQADLATLDAIGETPWRSGREITATARQWARGQRVLCNG